MKNFLLTAATVALTAVAAHAETHEISSYAEITQYIAGADTLVVTDLDNTVLESPQMLGSVQWVDSIIPKLLKGGLSEDLAHEMASGLFAEVNRFSPIKPVEASTPELIRNVQKKASMLALTARGLSLATRTVEQLREIGVNFETDLKKDKISLPLHPTEGTSYLKGVVSAGSKDKGVALREILEKNLPGRFKRILFIDDKLRYSQQVEKAFAGTSYEVHTFRYGAADAKVNAFDARIADHQWKHFQRTAKIQTDAEAAKALAL